jgi:uncharacterized protein YndB with AHSA1/START domain
VVTPSFGVSRTFDTTVERLWTAFTDEDELEAWYLPPDSQVLLSQMKLSRGGTYRYGVETPDGFAIWGQWDIRRVEPPSLLTFVQFFSDKAGAVARDPHDPEWPRLLSSEFRFATQFGGATVTINLSPLDASETEIAAFRMGLLGMSQGWERALDALAARLNRP